MLTAPAKLAKQSKGSAFSNFSWLDVAFLLAKGANALTGEN